MDATAFIQSFLINVYGSLDNLAHIWCHEKDLRNSKGNFLDPKFVGLGSKNKLVRSSLPSSVRSYLEKCEKWLKYLEDYRHSLAHRIPLYIPPYRLSPKNEVLYRNLDTQRIIAMSQKQWQIADEIMDQMDGIGVFEPYIMHSFGERAKPIVFHSQLICDLATIIEIGEKIMRSLK